MNLYGIRTEFGNMCRTGGIDEMEPLRDGWINNGWERINQEFVIPALKRNITFDAVADQQSYCFPYDYNGTEVGLKYNGRRLDPVDDEALRLRYEKRTGNMGSVKFYDWSGTIEEDLLSLVNCTLTNGSVTILTTSSSPLLDQAHWVRFDPYEDQANEDADNNNMVDPGDFGYLIAAGQQNAGTSFALRRPYRGPTGDQFTARVRPSETQCFLVYGFPSSGEADAFDLQYYAKAKRLYNDSDTPEWPDMGMAIAYMAMSVCLEWHHNLDLSRIFWGRAVARVTGLQRRRARTRALVTDLPIGSISGRRTGLHGIVNRGAVGSIGRYR